MLRSLENTQPNADRNVSWPLTPMTMEAWSHRWSLFADIHVLHPRDLSGRNYVQDFVTDHLAGTRMMSGCQLATHGRRHAEQTGGAIKVQRIYAGFAALEFSNANYVHRPGLIAIVDELNEYRLSQHGAVSETIWVPRARLGLSELHSISPIVIPCESGPGELIAEEMQRFFDLSARGDIMDPNKLERTLRHLLQDDLYPSSDREEWWRGRKHLIRKYIETHLEDPNLGPLQICQLFNMSRATLYRMFEADGGVRRFIQDRRLFSAIWDLATGGIRRGRLSRVAEKWGFSSDANFNRAAKAAFGMPPGALFRDRWQIGQRDSDSHPQNFEIFDWFKTHQTVKQSENFIKTDLFAL